jgi:Tol biopolymer transport system component
VLYGYQKNAAATTRFESSATTAIARATLYSPSPSDPALTSFSSSPDSQWVLFSTNAGGAQPNLRAIPPTGGSATNHGQAVFKLTTPDSGRIAYTRIVSTTTSTTELFSAQIFGGDERELSGLNSVGFVGDAAVSADGNWIVFTAQVDGRLDLRVSDGNAAQQAPTRFFVNLPLLRR